MKITGIELEDQDIAYIITDVLETNAIGYWAIYTHWKRIKSENENLDKCVEDIFIKELNEEETDFTVPHIVNRETIVKGVELIVTGRVNAPQIRDMILDNDIDADGVDCIVQAGLFGEIKYG